MPQPRYRYTTSYYGFPPGVKWLIIVNTAVFLLQYLGGSTVNALLSLWFGLRVESVFHLFFVWQIFTYMFLHGGILHLLFNMLTLWFFGTQLEQDWGTKRFLNYYFMCGMAAGVCVLAANALTGFYGATIGASGAIFGLLVAFGVLYPNQTVLMSFLFPIKAKYMVMIYAGIELLMTFGPNNGVSTVAHLGGMAFGYLYLKRRLPSFKVRVPDVGGAYRRWQVARAKRKFQVYLRKHNDRGPWVN